MKHINTDERKIWTAEDPIEITQEGLRQVQVHPKIGFTFAAAMRAFLRADPDVIMIGEMRDKETADIAIEASLTGHLVMSTLHTNSAVETVTRLLDMGCDSFNFADAMLGVLAMRLCKRICSHCKESVPPDSDRNMTNSYKAMAARYWDKLGVSYTEDLILYRGRGCETCNHSGFKGRVALHELLVGSEEIKNLIQGKARTAEILSVAMRDGMVTLAAEWYSESPKRSDDLSSSPSRCDKVALRGEVNDLLNLLGDLLQQQSERSQLHEHIWANADEFQPTSVLGDPTYSGQLNLSWPLAV